MKRFSVKRLFVLLGVVSATAAIVASSALAGAPVPTTQCKGRGTAERPDHGQPRCSRWCDVLCDRRHRHRQRLGAGRVRSWRSDDRGEREREQRRRFLCVRRPVDHQRQPGYQRFGRHWLPRRQRLQHRRPERGVGQLQLHRQLGTALLGGNSGNEALLVKKNFNHSLNTNALWLEDGGAHGQRQLDHRVTTATTAGRMKGRETGPSPFEQRMSICDIRVSRRSATLR